MAEARRLSRRASSIRRPVSRVLYGDGRTRRVTAIPLGRRLRDASRDLPGRPIADTIRLRRLRAKRAVPIRSCSRRGLPCRPRCRERGALLPHPFTLARLALRASAGGLLSVALSLGSPPAGVTRRLMSMEPGLSSRRLRMARAAVRPSDPLEGRRFRRRDQDKREPTPLNKRRKVATGRLVRDAVDALRPPVALEGRDDRRRSPRRSDCRTAALVAEAEQSRACKGEDADALVADFECGARRGRRRLEPAGRCRPRPAASRGRARRDPPCGRARRRNGRRCVRRNRRGACDVATERDHRLDLGVGEIAVAELVARVDDLDADRGELMSVAPFHDEHAGVPGARAPRGRAERCGRPPRRDSGRRPSPPGRAGGRARPRPSACRCSAAAKYRSRLCVRRGWATAACGLM